MNSLSWFLYFVDIFGNLQGLIIFASLAFIILFTIVLVATEYYNESSYSSRATNTQKPYPSKKLLVIPVIMWFVAALIPNQNTMYLILASEVSGKVVTTPEGKKIMQDVYEIVQKKLNEAKIAP